MRPARIKRHVPANGANLLTARVGGEVQPVRSRGLTDGQIWFMAMTSPSSTGTAPPLKLVPLPRAMNGTAHAAQMLTAATTSSLVTGTTTARGVAAKAVSPSLSYAANAAPSSRQRSGGKMA